jgi:hypothetical protein
MTKYEGDTTAVLTKLRKVREGANMPCEDIVDLVDEAMNIEGRMLNALYDPQPGMYSTREEVNKIKQLHLEAHTAFDIVAERCCLKDVEDKSKPKCSIIDADAEAAKYGIRGRDFAVSKTLSAANRHLDKEHKKQVNSIIDAELRKPRWTRSGQ